MLTITRMYMPFAWCHMRGMWPHSIWAWWSQFQLLILPVIFMRRRSIWTPSQGTFGLWFISWISVVKHLKILFFICVMIFFRLSFSLLVVSSHRIGELQMPIVQQNGPIFMSTLQNLLLRPSCQTQGFQIREECTNSMSQVQLRNTRNKRIEHVNTVT